MQRTVLFAWECGAGMGHLANIRPIAKELRRRGLATPAHPSRYAKWLRKRPSSSRMSTHEGAMMNLEDLLFIGLNGYAVALHRDTGQIVWSNNEMRSGYVTLLLDGDRLIVSTNGYLYCLDPLTGRILWHNPMKGYGAGAPTSITSVRGSSNQTVIAQAAKASADAASAAAATA